MRGSIPLPHFVIEFPVPSPLIQFVVNAAYAVTFLLHRILSLRGRSVQRVSERASEVGIWSSELERRRSIWMGKRGQHISKLDLKGRAHSHSGLLPRREGRDGPIIERAHSSCRFHRWLLRLTTRVAHLDGSHNVMVPIIRRVSPVSP